MKFAIFCVVIFAALSVTVSAQDLDENSHYLEYKKWAVAAQHKRPLPVMYDFCKEAYDKMIASGVSPSTRVREEVMREDIDFPTIEWKGTVKELNDRLCLRAQTKLADDIAAKHAPYKGRSKGGQTAARR